MNREAIIYFLNEYRQAKKRLEVARLNFEEELEILTQIQIDYSRIKVQTSSEYDKIGDRIEKLNEKRKICDEELNEALIKMELVMAIISSVKDHAQRELLTRRYITCDTWENIAEKMNYSRAQVFRIHDKAVVDLCNMRRNETINLC